MKCQKINTLFSISLLYLLDKAQAFGDEVSTTSIPSSSEVALNAQQQGERIQLGMIVALWVVGIIAALFFLVCQDGARNERVKTHYNVGAAFKKDDDCEILSNLDPDNIVAMRPLSKKKASNQLNTY